MNLLKQAQEMAIIKETANLFFARSITEVTIKDIASALGVGEATIYRHYSTKFNLVLMVAKYLQEDVLSQYFSFVNEGNGYSKLAKFYKSFLQIYKEHPAYYKFINEFDAYVITNSSKEMHSYEEGIDAFKNTFDAIYKEGVDDGSVVPLENIDSFYYGTTHSLLALCKKLSDKDVISQDAHLDKVGEIEALIDTVLYRLNKTN